jgi:hypothetical protein
MIAHQAPGQNADIGVLQILAQQAQIGMAILAGRKGLAAVDAALSDVTGDSGEKAAAAGGA